MATHDDDQPRDPPLKQVSRNGNEVSPGPTIQHPDPKAGLAREVGDLEDPDAVEDDGALPGRVGGGLAGG